MQHHKTNTPAADVDTFPLVSVFHTTYNQTEGLREALLASLNQDYPNLEIVVSDDCSTDKTFDIVQDVVADYDGPHEVRMARNDRNLKIVGHVNTAVRKTRGQLIVQALGDDLSQPDRVSRLVAAWRADPAARLVFSQAIWVGKDGQAVRHLNTRPESDYQVSPTDFILNRLYTTGAAIAYDRRIFDELGPIPNVATVEDTILPFRALLLGTIRKVDEVLVKMPIGGGSWFDGDPADRERIRARTLRNMVNTRRAVLIDIQGRRFPGKARLVLYCRFFLMAHSIGRLVPHLGRSWTTFKTIDTHIRRKLVRSDGR